MPKRQSFERCIAHAGHCALRLLSAGLSTIRLASRTGIARLGAAVIGQPKTSLLAKAVPQLHTCHISDLDA